jgi:hypothetical protein
MKYHKLYESWNRHLEEGYNASQRSAAGHRFDNYKRTIRMLLHAEVISNDLAQEAAEEVHEPNKGLRSGEVPINSGLDHYYSIQRAVEKAIKNRVDNAEDIAAEWKQTNRSVTHEAVEEELETIVSEDSESDAEIVNLLTQINQKLDGLDDIDTSIDYLIGALSGETALSAKMKQSTLGRFADASPQLAELIKKYQK